MYSYNYKGLPYRQSVKQFINDYRFWYNLYGKHKKWKTKDGKKIAICKLNIIHLRNIVNKYGNTYIRNNYPFLWYRYLKIFKR